MKRRAKDPRGRIPDIKASLMPRLEDLRHTVENVDMFPGLLPGMLLTTSWDGFTFGYKVVEQPADMFLRVIKIHCDEARIEEIPKDEWAEIMNTVFDAFLDRGCPAKVLDKGPCDRWVKQLFIPTLLTKRGSAMGHITFNDKHIRDGYLIN